MNKIIVLCISIIMLPVSIVVIIIKSLFFRSPLNRIIDKTNFFLKAQISTLEGIDENKYALITWESLAYVVAIAEEYGRRKIRNDELKPLLLCVFGKDYESRINYLLNSLKEKYEPDAFNKIVENIRQLARDDVEAGAFFCSNFLVTNAEEIQERDLKSQIAYFKSIDDFESLKKIYTKVLEKASKKHTDHYNSTDFYINYQSIIEDYLPEYSYFSSADETNS